MFTPHYENILCEEHAPRAKHIHSIYFIPSFPADI